MVDRMKRREIAGLGNQFAGLNPVRTITGCPDGLDSALAMRKNRIVTDTLHLNCATEGTGLNAVECGPQ